MKCPVVSLVFIIFSLFPLSVNEFEGDLSHTVFAFGPTAVNPVVALVLALKSPQQTIGLVEPVRALPNLLFGLDATDSHLLGKTLTSLVMRHPRVLDPCTVVLLFYETEFPVPELELIRLHQLTHGLQPFRSEPRVVSHHLALEVVHHLLKKLDRKWR